jgi:outer membrane protein TolC
LLGLPLLWSLSIRHASAQTAPEARAAAHAAQAARQEGDAEAELPPLEVMLDVWGVPFERPHAVDDADMIRVGVEQQLPAPGERANLRRAANLRAQSFVAEGEARSRALALRKAHALVEQYAALRSHQVHLVHLQLSERTLEIARARHAAGGALADVSTAEVETARAAALVAADEARARTSRAVLAALQGVEPLKPVRERPELVALRLARDAELTQAEAARVRNAWPAPRVGASYFAPSASMDEHGFGISLGMSLPWLWGSRAGSQHAAVSRSRALDQELSAKKRDLALEIVEAQGAVNAAQASLSVLRERVLPATLRARRLAQGAYESGQGRLDDVLRAEAQQVEIEMQMVELESELAHRNTDLDFALGRVAPRSQVVQEKNHDR